MGIRTVKKKLKDLSVDGTKETKPTKIEITTIKNLSVDEIKETEHTK